MKEVRARVTKKGQVTIPIEVRRLLGITAPGDVAFVVDDHGVRLRQRRSAVDETAGAVPYDGPPLSARQMREAAEIAIVEDVIERTAT